MDITVASFAIPLMQFPDLAEGELRLYANREWLDSDGVIHVGGGLGGQVGFYQACPFTVTDTTATVATFVTQSTVDAQDNAPSTILISGQLFDTSGQYLGSLFSDWQIPNATPTTFAALWNANRGRTLPIANPNYVTVQDMIDYVQSVLGSRAYASSVILGNTYLDIDPTVVIRPESVGSNSPRAALRKNGNATLSGGTVTVLSSLVAAASNIQLTGQDDNVSGSLRISARTIGVSFTITSTNGADSGVVGWSIFDPT
jgi:hypothetical protein